MIQDLPHFSRSNDYKQRSFSEISSLTPRLRLPQLVCRGTVGSWFIGPEKPLTGMASYRLYKRTGCSASHL